MGDQPGQATNGPTRRRRFARFPISLPVLARAGHASGQEVGGTVRDIGAGGLMADFPVEMAPRSAIWLLLQRRRGPLEMKGRVVWTAVTQGMIRHGVAFPEPKGQDFAMDLFLAERR